MIYDYIWSIIYDYDYNRLYDFIYIILYIYNKFCNEDIMLESEKLNLLWNWAYKFYYFSF